MTVTFSPPGRWPKWQEEGRTHVGDVRAELWTARQQDKKRKTMSDGVAGAGTSAHRKAFGQADTGASSTGASKGKPTAAPTDAHATAASAPSTQGSSSDTGKSCGIAGMGSADPVVHLPDLPPAQPAIFSGTNSSTSSRGAGGTCVSESARPVAPRTADAQSVRPATPPQNAGATTPAWKSEILDQLSRYHEIEDFVAFLKGLENGEQRRFAVDFVLARLTSLGDAINELTRQIRNDPGDPALRRIVVEQILHRAAVLESKKQAGKPRHAGWSAPSSRRLRPGCPEGHARRRTGRADCAEAVAKGGRTPCQDT